MSIPYLEEHFKFMKRLIEKVTEAMDMLEQSGKPTLSHEVKDLLRQISPATIDRLLSRHRPKFPKGYLGLNPIEDSPSDGEEPE